ncbi:MAG: hypothetical protein NTW95_08420 [Candidatus Aminicenantes bacterium]|nr:hypothetical protein [Candidatus Aminicenantes bacterium]
MKKRIWIVLLVVSLGINIGFLLHWFWPKNVSGYSPGKGQAQFGWHAGPMRRGLGLDSNQARLMENERRQVLAQAQPLQEQLRLKRRELFLLLKSKAVTGAELDIALNEISRLQTAIEKFFILHSLGPFRGHGRGSAVAGCRWLPGKGRLRKEDEGRRL